MPAQVTMIIPTYLCTCVFQPNPTQPNPALARGHAAAAVLARLVISTGRRCGPHLFARDAAVAPRSRFSGTRDRDPGHPLLSHMDFMSTLLTQLMVEASPLQCRRPSGPAATAATAPPGPASGAPDCGCACLEGWTMTTGIPIVPELATEYQQTFSKSSLTLSTTLSSWHCTGTRYLHQKST